MKPAILSGFWFLIYVSNLVLIQGGWLLQMLFLLKSSFVWAHRQEIAVMSDWCFIFKCSQRGRVLVEWRVKSFPTPLSNSNTDKTMTQALMKEVYIPPDLPMFQFQGWLSPHFQSIDGGVEFFIWCSVLRKREMMQGREYFFPSHSSSTHMNKK